ncbi:MAG TPA: protein kinase [Polyangiaceae bacterium]|nr:protein kinase [Polyangiaceae bacterium]
MAQGSGPGGALAFGRYELRVELARSQLGSLWVAKPPETAGGPELVCVRRLRTGPPLSTDDAQRLTEAAWASLPVRHPSVLSVLDVVVTEDELGVVSEYVECEPVRSILRLPGFRRKPLSPALALLVARDVLEALETVFSQTAATPHAPRMSGGLSPDSVLLGTDGRARLTDLGIASILKAIPKFASHPDLAAYAPPEQLAFSNELDERAEIFTLGVLIWELVTGRRLFVAATHAAVSEKVRSEEIARLDASRPFGGEAVPKSVADLVAHALEREPSARFASLSEMRMAIEALGAAPLATREELGGRVGELASNAFSARTSALASAAAAADAGLPPASRGALLSSAPPKARRPLHKQTLLGVAPTTLAQPGGGVRRPSRPPNTPLPPPPSAAPGIPAMPSYKRGGRSPTLLGVAPPQVPPPAPQPAVELDPLDLDDMRPSKPPFNGGEAPAAAASTGMTGWNALMAAPESEDAARAPSLESPSAFDFMADRQDDNVATLRKSQDYGPASSPDATLPHGSPFEDPQAHAFALPNTHTFTDGAPPPSSQQFPPQEAQGWPAAATQRMSAPLDATAAQFAPRPSGAPTRKLEPDELPKLDAVSPARAQRLRRIVAAIVAATAALLICALVVAALRDDDKPADATAVSTEEPTASGKRAPAADKAAGATREKPRANPTKPIKAETQPAGRSATPPIEAAAAGKSSASLVDEATTEAKNAKAATQKRPTPVAKQPRTKATKKPATKAVTAKKAASKKTAKAKSKTAKRPAAKKSTAKKTK